MLAVLIGKTPVGVLGKLFPVITRLPEASSATLNTLGNMTLPSTVGFLVKSHVPSLFVQSLAFELPVPLAGTEQSQSEPKTGCVCPLSLRKIFAFPKGKRVRSNDREALVAGATVILSTALNSYDEVEDDTVLEIIILVPNFILRMSAARIEVAVPLLYKFTVCALTICAAYPVVKNILITMNKRVV
jgi:hypothetical protein